MVLNGYVRWQSFGYFIVQSRVYICSNQINSTQNFGVYGGIHEAEQLFMGGCKDLSPCHGLSKTQRLKSWIQWDSGYDIQL